ncbi:hypothetical protein GCM10009646_05720 [Streptomyces aureus]
MQRTPSRRSWKAPGTLTGDRTQGSQRYSIRATRVDRHAIEVLMGDGSWVRGITRSGFTDVACFTESPETELITSCTRPYLVK